MSSASVALQASLTPEPVLEALRSLAGPRADGTANRVDDERTANTTAVSWVEPTDSLWVLSIKNFGLALATFGVYHFWGRAEMNRQVVNAIHVDGKPVDYTGTGREAFISFTLGTAIAAAIVSVFVYLLLQMPAASTTGATIEGIRQFRWQRLIISLPLLFLLGSIAYRKRHHVLRRSWVSGERFRLTGFAWGYAWLHFWSAFMVPLTLGWAAPWRSSMLAARKINDMQHDSGMRFAARPELGGLYRAFALIWFGGGIVYVLTLLALAQVIGPELMGAINGLTFEPLKSWAVAQAAAKVLAVALLPLLLCGLVWRKAWLEHQISAIAFDGGRLRLNMPLGAYLITSLRGLALAVVSLGCFKPVARAQMMRFIVEHIRIEGTLKLQPAVIKR